MTRLFPRTTLLSALLAVSVQSQATGFGINATRLIYPGGAGSISVAVRNTEPQTPFLVQAAVSGQQETRTAAPFAVTPPLFRLEQQSTNQLRITFTGASLPHDRESVFYFHATAIPAGTAGTPTQPGNTVSGGARFGVGSIIKLFYRPSGLPGSSASAQKGLTFVRENGELKVTNHSPYFVSLAGVSAGAQRLALNTQAARMLAPYASHSWPVKTPLSSGTQVFWQTINDAGGIDEFNANVQ